MSQPQALAIIFAILVMLLAAYNSVRVQTYTMAGKIERFRSNVPFGIAMFGAAMLMTLILLVKLGLLTIPGTH